MFSLYDKRCLYEISFRGEWKYFAMSRLQTTWNDFHFCLQDSHDRWCHANISSFRDMKLQNILLIFMWNGLYNFENDKHVTFSPKIKKGEGKKISLLEQLTEDLWMRAILPSVVTTVRFCLCMQMFGYNPTFNRAVTWKF